MKRTVYFTIKLGEGIQRDLSPYNCQMVFSGSGFGVPCWGWRKTSRKHHCRFQSPVLFTWFHLVLATTSPFCFQNPTTPESIIMGYMGYPRDIWDKNIYPWSIWDILSLLLTTSRLCHRTIGSEGGLEGANQATSTGAERWGRDEQYTVGKQEHDIYHWIIGIYWNPIGIHLDLSKVCIEQSRSQFFLNGIYKSALLTDGNQSISDLIKQYWFVVGGWWLSHDVNVS